MIIEKPLRNKNGDIVLIKLVSDEKQTLYWRFINWLLGCPCCGKGGHIFRIIISICILIFLWIALINVFPINLLFFIFLIPQIYIVLKIDM